MPRKRLTEEGVKKLLPHATKQVDYYDTVVPGLVLRLSYGGAKTWRVLHYVQRKTKVHGLGRFPILNVAQAREQARRFLENPTKAEAGTFREVAQNFIKRHVEKHKLRSQYEIERILNKYIYPRWQDREFTDINRGDVAILLDRIEDDNGPRQADMCLAILSKMMRWYAARDKYYVSVVVPGMQRSNPAERRRKRILEDDEIRAMWKMAEGSFGAILKLALLSAQRREKIVTMKWADLADGVWTIAEEAREKASAGSLRLPKLALAILKQQPRISGNPFVFASPRGKKYFNSWALRKQELDERMPPGKNPWVIHDLRRTARSLMSRAKVSREHAERVLGHAIPGVEGVYNRYQFADEKADALQRLAGLVEDILKSPVDLSQEAHELRDANQAKERNTLLMAKKVKAKPRKRAKAKPASKERRADGLVVGSDGAKLVDAICAKSGATHAELKALIKWKSCLPFAMKSAKQAGIRLRKEREGKEVRYYGTARA
jgi:integrase